MSWSKALAAAACLVLAGCGFHPLYGDSHPSDGLSQQLASIKGTKVAKAASEGGVCVANSGTLGDCGTALNRDDSEDPRARRTPRRDGRLNFEKRARMDFEPAPALGL